jgi:predicted enzyme related to lactoylglutathione lyase
MSNGGDVGQIGWIDMSTADAGGLRDFYKAVTGWQTEDVSMDDYSDYVMKTPASGQGVAGVRHAPGSNAEPAQGLADLHCAGRS